MERMAVRVRRGFSLVEVLIAVLVLALGLLGLAAVFPAVIAQQRDAVDRTQGAVVAEVVEQTLRSSDGLVDFARLRRDFWFSAAAALDCGEGIDLDPENMSFLWEPDWEWGPNNHMLQMRPSYADYWTYGTIPVGLGKYYDLNCNAQTPKRDDPYYIPVTSRLFPQPYSGEEPQYVWDFVARRARLGGEATGLELAVFIRRVDPGIRVPRGNTLSDVLTGQGVAAGQARLPVAVDGSTGLPSGDGTGVYSVPQTMAVRVDADEPDRIVFAGSGADEELWRQTVASPGQILVDNLGNVLNVVRVPEDEGGEPGVIVDHEYQESETGIPSVDERGTKVEQILFTPQKPVRVFTMRQDW